MISVANIDHDFEMEVEFLNLSKLAFSFYRAHHFEMGLNMPGVRLLEDKEKDRCATLSESLCPDDPECFSHYEPQMKNTYLRKCSSRSRKFDYRDKAVFSYKNVIIERQQYEQLFCDERNSEDFNLFFTSHEGNATPIFMYYRLIRSKRTGINYVMFSSGMVLAGPDVLDNLKLWALEIKDKVKGNVEPGSKVCICGHSMGATLSMVLAYHWFDTDDKYFDNFVTVVALGAMNLFNEEDGFKELPNIRSYLSYERTEQNMFVDPYCLRGDRSKVLFSPVILIQPPKGGRFDLTNKIETSRKDVEHPNAVFQGTEYTIVINQSRTELHKLIYYIDEMLKIATILPSIDGGRRSRKSKKHNAHFRSHLRAAVRKRRLRTRKYSGHANKVCGSLASRLKE